MAFNPLFYQLLLIMRVLLCLLVHVGLPNDPPRVPNTPLESKPRRPAAGVIVNSAACCVLYNLVY